MSLVGFRAANHRQQVARRGARETVDDRRTPAELFDSLNAEYRFTLDVAATAENAKTVCWCADGLTESWAGERIWCNPPYSNLAPWLAKAWHEHRACPVIVMLLPANRTEQGWWQEYVEPHRDRPGSPLSVRFLAGRLRFDRPGWTKPRKGDRPPLRMLPADLGERPTSARHPQPGRVSAVAHQRGGGMSGDDKPRWIVNPNGFDGIELPARPVATQGNLFAGEAR